MGRRVVLASQIYEAGTTKEIFLDDFPGNFNVFIVTLTRENWPGQPSDDVITLTMKWNDGTGKIVTLPGGTVLGRDGQPVLLQTHRSSVPRVGPGLVNVVGGSVRVEFHATLSTAITAEVKLA